MYLDQNNRLSNARIAKVMCASILLELLANILEAARLRVQSGPHQKVFV